jgi:hypothetical protein
MERFPIRTTHVMFVARTARKVALGFAVRRVRQNNGRLADPKEN